MSKWIKCSERMPDSADPVLVVFHEKTSYYTWSFERDVWTSDGHTLPLSVVTHWQPLPEPPNE